jgi:hypothetical protein
MMNLNVIFIFSQQLAARSSDSDSGCAIKKKKIKISTVI